MNKKTKIKIGTVDKLILDLLKHEYELGNEEFVDLTEEFSQVPLDSLRDCAKYLSTQGFIKHFFAGENGNTEIFGKITKKGLLYLAGGMKKSGRNLREIMADLADFISDSKVVISAVVVILFGFGWWFNVHSHLLQGSFLEVFVTKEKTAEDMIKDSMSAGDDSNVDITPLGQSDGKYFFQVGSGDDGEVQYFFFELEQDEESGEWKIVGIEKLH